VKLPADPDAEATVLGAILLRNDAFNAVAGVVGEDDLYVPAHRAAFRAMCKLADKGEPIDTLTLEAQLRVAGELNLVGGLEGISRLASGVASSHNVVAHAKRVRAIAAQRRFAVRCSELAERACEVHDDPEDWCERASDRLATISRSTRDGLVSMADRLHSTVRAALDRSLAPRPSLDLPWPDLRVITGPLRWPQVVVIAARPGMGKTAFALDAVLAAGAPALFFSLEMTADELLERGISSHGQIHGGAWDDADRMRGSFDDIVRTAGSLERVPLTIDDTAEDIRHIRSVARGWRRDRKRFPTGDELGIIAIDYVQLCTTKRHHPSREQVVAEISREVKRMAKELRVPVLLLAQLSRDLEKRSDHRPQLADLRESGALEQDADKVLFIHRPDFFDRSAAEGVAEIYVRKNRKGSVGMAKLDFVGHLTTFVDHERRYAAGGST
jgi:replicative DNA helicase